MTPGDDTCMDENPSWGFRTGQGRNCPIPAWAWTGLPLVGGMFLEGVVVGSSETPEAHPGVTDIVGHKVFSYGSSGPPMQALA